MYVLVHDADGDEALLPIDFEMAVTGYYESKGKVDKTTGTVVPLDSSKKPKKVRVTVVYFHSGNTFSIVETPAELKKLIDEVRYDTEGEYIEEPSEEDPCTEDGADARGC